MIATFSDKKLHKINRIDSAVAEYFAKNPVKDKVLAIDLMPSFIKKGLFIRDHHSGYPIRVLLNELNRLEMLHLLKLNKATRSGTGKQWYFERIVK